MMLILFRVCSSRSTDIYIYESKFLLQAIAKQAKVTLLAIVRVLILTALFSFYIGVVSLSVWTKTHFVEQVSLNSSSREQI